MAGDEPEAGGLSLLLVGAGGHARAIAEALAAGESPIDAYVDPRPSDWLKARHVGSDGEAETLPAQGFVLGVGGVSPEDLSRRHALYRRYRERGWRPCTVVHPTAVVSAHARIGEGSVILAGAIVQPGAVLEEAVIVNTGAIVEHDSAVGAGAHIAPGAIALGGCAIGAACMIGAGAVVLPDASVPDRTLVPAGERFPQ